MKNRSLLHCTFLTNHKPLLSPSFTLDFGPITNEDELHYHMIHPPERTQDHSECFTEAQREAKILKINKTSTDLNTIIIRSKNNIKANTR